MRVYVRCYWELQGRAGHPGVLETILPDGCTELVIHFGDPFLCGDILQPRVMFVGQMTRPTTVEPSGNAGCFGIRFEPAGAWALFGFRQADMFEQIVADGHLLGGDVERRMLSAETTAERKRLIETALLAIAPSRPDPWCPAASRILGRTQLTADLQRDCGIGTRQLERIFLDRIGMTPRLFARLARFRQALGCRGAWADVAASCGYYGK